MPAALADFLANWFLAYTGLLLVYFSASAAVSYWNRTRLAHLKIQARRCPRDLVIRDALRSVWSLVSIAAFCALGRTGYQHGLGFDASGHGPAAWALSFAASFLLFDTWFYWGHRLLHIRALYGPAHAWHHRATIPTPWSNNSETFLDNCVCQSYWAFAHLLLPIHPGVLMAHKLFDQVTGALGHAGYEWAAAPTSRWPFLLVGTTFHDDHHRLFDVNYATHTSFWDRLCGTIDPDYDARMDRMIARARAGVRGSRPADPE